MGKAVVGKSRVTVFQPLYQKPISELTPEEFYKVEGKDLVWKGQYWDGKVRDFLDYVNRYKHDNVFLRFAEDWDSFCRKYFEKPSVFIDALLEIAHSLDDNDWSWVQIENKVNAQLKSRGTQPVVTDEMKDRIFQLRSEGKTEREIAKAVKVSQQTVNRVLTHKCYTYNICESNTRSPKQRGTSAEYRQARLDRDHPELAQRVRQGEITLASACKEVGIAKRMIAEFKIDEDRTPSSLAKSMTERLPLEFINDLYSELGKLIQEHHNEHHWIP